MRRRPGRAWLISLFSSAVGSQAILSAASFAVGLLLIRRSSGEQYGAYILVANAFLLLASLQNAFFGPTLVLRLSALGPHRRAALVGGLYHEQKQVLLLLFAVLTMAVAACSLGGKLRPATAALLLAATVAAPFALTREYFRSAALAQRRAGDVVRADLVYAGTLVAGAALATCAPLPAAGAVVAMALAALAGAALLSRALSRGRPWGAAPGTGLLRQIAALGAWSTAGAAIHWTFSQGYSYLVAATLDVSAVAAIAATRLLLMPVNLLSTGVGSIMLPLAAGWLRRLGPGPVFRRLWLAAIGLAALALGYIALMWLLRDWIFAHLLRKEFAQRDRLLLLWSAISLLMVVRDQTVPLMVACGRLRRLTMLTLCSATLSLLLSYWGMRHFGIPGALCGVLCGEAGNVALIFLASAREVLRRPQQRAGCEPARSQTLERMAEVSPVAPSG